MSEGVSEHPLLQAALNMSSYFRCNGGNAVGEEPCGKELGETSSQCRLVKMGTWA